MYLNSSGTSRVGELVASKRAYGPPLAAPATRAHKALLLAGGVGARHRGGRAHDHAAAETQAAGRADRRSEGGAQRDEEEDGVERGYAREDEEVGAVEAEDAQRGEGDEHERGEAGYHGRDNEWGAEAGHDALDRVLADEEHGELVDVLIFVFVVVRGAAARST